LYLESSGDLIMLDSKAWNSFKTIIRIDTNYQNTGEWFGTEVSTVNAETQEFGGLTTLFTVGGTVYGISSGTDPDYIRTVGQYDINEPEYIAGTTSNVNLYKNDYHINNSGNYYDYAVISVVRSSDGKVYLSAFYPDPDTEGFEFGLFNLNVTTGVANWIKWSYPVEYGNDPIVTLFTK